MEISLMIKTADGKKVTTSIKIVDNDEKMQIFVKPLNGNKFILQVEPSETISNMKVMIKEKQGINTDEQRLVYAEKELKDERTLAYYNIQKDNTIYLIVRLQGGMTSK
ncbi:Ubiquitin [Dendrobium catenatum]|uniref:Ubiquitin n=1 Tax=Dendrobium catenatum TaxID=906689 RepID=A0A2I0VEM6_9ASPA|nr:Ubiquitin [Dendrobium catenatum]